MLDLIKITESNEVVTDSLKVAKFFKKEHRTVLRSIENVIKQGVIAQLNFVPCYYEDKYHKNLPYYKMDKDGFALLAMGFTGKNAHQFKLEYIRAFNGAIALIQEQREILTKRLKTENEELTDYKKYLNLKVKQLNECNTQAESKVREFKIEKALEQFGEPSEISGLPRTLPISYFRGQKNPNVVVFSDQLGLYGNIENGATFIPIGDKS